MAHVSYTYKSFPNCPEATQYSKDRESYTAVLAGFVGLWTIVAVIYFIVCSFKFFGNYNWSDFSLSLFWLVFSAIFVFCFIVCRPRKTECELKIILIKSENKALPQEVINNYCDSLRKENRKENINTAKIFFPTFLLLVLAVLSLIGTIKGIYFLCHKQDGLFLLIGSLGVLCIIGLVAWYLQNRWSYGDPIIPHVRKKQDEHKTTKEVHNKDRSDYSSSNSTPQNNTSKTIQVQPISKDLPQAVTVTDIHDLGNHFGKFVKLTIDNLDNWDTHKLRMSRPLSDEEVQSILNKPLTELEYSTIRGRICVKIEPISVIKAKSYEDNHYIYGILRISPNGDYVLTNAFIATSDSHLQIVAKALKSQGMFESSILDDGTISVFNFSSDDEIDKLFCRRCGAQLPLDSDFCFKCGTKVDKNVV